MTIGSRRGASARRPALLLGALAALGCATPRVGAISGAPSNVAAGRPAFLIEASGDPATITDGKLDPEGTLPARIVAFPGVRSAVVVDLGEVRSLAALLIQAGAADVYFVEVSTDNASWAVAWRVAPVHSAPGVRTRTTVLPRPVPARWLRVRPTTGRSPVLSEIQAFESRPVEWPRLDLSHPASPLPLWPGLARERLDALYEALAALLMLVVGWSVWARRSSPPPQEERIRKTALVLVALAAIVAWPNLFNFHYYTPIHKWEFFHYYLGGKYLRELGYTRLYLCAAAVDAEDGIDLGPYLLRDLSDNRLVPAASEARRFPECRSRFSDDRWEQFRRDARFFRAAMGMEDWAAVRRDHGFNGTPVWALEGGLLAGLGPASWTQIHLLALLDPVLLVAAFVILGRSSGMESACLAAGWWGVNALAPFGWTGGAYLRYDWFFWLVAGVAALKSRRPALAGFALAWATLVRVFPGCAILGVAASAVVAAIGERSLDGLKRQGRFFAGAAAAVLLLLPSSSLAVGRAEIWREFLRNSAKHLATEASNSIGLRSFLAHRHDTRLELMVDPLLLDRSAPWEADRVAAERAFRAGVWAAGAAFLLLLGLAVRGQPTWVAAVLGLALTPVFLTLSSYYFCVLVLFAALWALSPGSGLALAALAWASNVVMRLWPSPDDQYAWLSLAVVGLVSGILTAFARKGGRPAEASVTSAVLAGSTASRAT